jgi:hypothetical protein
VPGGVGEVVVASPGPQQGERFAFELVALTVVVRQFDRPLRRTIAANSPPAPTAEAAPGRLPRPALRLSVLCLLAAR